MLAASDRIDQLRNSAARGNLLGVLPKALKDRSAAVRGDAVLLAAEHGLKGVLPLLERLLTDRSEEVRRDAAEAVGILSKGPGASHRGLRSLLSDRSSLVRTQAIESLGLIGDRSALPAIARLLSDRNPIVRSYAASAIGELGGQRYLKKIRQALTKEKRDLARVGLLEAMLLLGEHNVFEEFLELLKSSDYHVRCSVANSLELIPLDKAQTQLAIASLIKANRKSLVLADRSTTKRVITNLKERRI